MPNEIPFRIALLIVMLSFSAIVVTFRRRSATRDQKMSRDEEGWIFRFLLLGSAILLWISTFAFLLMPHVIAWASIPILPVIRWTAFCFAILSTLPMIWTLRSLGKNFTGSETTKSDGYLVTSGPYRYVRHPYYTTTAITMASVTILTANWLIGLSCIGVLALIALRTSKEEENLVEKFGDEYLRYRNKTGKFLPWTKGS